MDFRKGPFLTSALLCEKVLVEKDGVKSAVRIFDRITHTPPVQTTSQPMVPFTHPMSLLIQFKKGEAQGSFFVRLALLRPAGDSPPDQIITVNFEGDEDRGVDIVSHMMLEFNTAGIYWIRVFLGRDEDEEFITQIPLRVIYLPQVMKIQG